MRKEDSDLNAVGENDVEDEPEIQLITCRF